MEKRIGKKISVAKMEPTTGEILKIYDSLTDAAKDMKNAQIGNISRACRGIINTHKGFGWRYLSSLELKNNRNKKIFNKVEQININSI